MNRVFSCSSKGSSPQNETNRFWASERCSFLFPFFIIYSYFIRERERERFTEHELMNERNSLGNVLNETIKSWEIISKFFFLKFFNSFSILFFASFFWASNVVLN